MNQEKKNNENLSDSDNETVSKRSKTKDEFTDRGVDKFQKMMEKMGHKTGEGLGKHNQGIVNPIKESNQKGKVGLGYNTGKIEEKIEAWDYSQEEVCHSD